MTGLLLGALAILAGLVWWQSATRARESAARCVARACAETGVQWLDGSVVFQRFELARDRDGSRHLRRTYVFDYCDDGVSRRQGFVALRGTDLEWIGFGPTGVAAPEPGRLP